MHIGHGSPFAIHGGGIGVLTVAYRLGGLEFQRRVIGKDKARQHVDPAEMNKLRQAHVALQGDLNALLPALQQPLDINEWRQHAADMRAEHAWRYDHPGEAIYAPLLLKQLSDRKPADSDQLYAFGGDFDH
jgi:thiamine pyrophosphate-dependent acetolactate synthase large subunit-like protein